MSNFILPIISALALAVLVPLARIAWVKRRREYKANQEAVWQRLLGEELLKPGETVFRWIKSKNFTEPLCEYATLVSVEPGRIVVEWEELSAYGDTDLKLTMPLSGKEIEDDVWWSVITEEE